MTEHSPEERKAIVNHLLRKFDGEPDYGSNFNKKLADYFNVTPKTIRKDRDEIKEVWDSVEEAVLKQKEDIKRSESCKTS